MTENEVFEHIVDVDEYVELRIKIPERLDVMSFTAILEKSRKLLRIGDVSIAPIKRNVRSDSDGSADEKLIEEYQGVGFGNSIKFAKEHGFKNVQSLHSKIYNIRKKLGIHKNNSGNSKRYSSDVLDKCVKMVIAGNSMTQIADKFDFPDARYLHKKIKAHTGKTFTELRRGK